VCIA